MCAEDGLTLLRAVIAEVKQKQLLEQQLVQSVQDAETRRLSQRSVHEQEMLEMKGRLEDTIVELSRKNEQSGTMEVFLLKQRVQALKVCVRDPVKSAIVVHLSDGARAG